MAADGHDTLTGYRSHLKEKLDCCFARGDGLEPEKRFARSGVTREILEAQRLVHLFRLLLFEDLPSINRKAKKCLGLIAKKIRGSGDSPTFCNILASLLYSRCKDETLRTWVESLNVPERTYDTLSDRDLPLTELEAEKAFGREDGLNFWEQHFLFCPVVLEEGDESVYVDHRKPCPLPFLKEPERIGKGASAIVYKVEIERGHLVNRAESSVLQNSKEYARKVYIDYDASAKKSFEAEGTTIKKFIQSAKSHENILVTKASLEHGSTYSLFFDLAKYSLDDYLMDAKVDLTSLALKKSVFGRASGLAGALAYLHDELYIASTGEHLRCYHLDLKPQNILVFESNGIDIWKISDFGISQIKRIPANKAHLEDDKHPVSFLDRIFRREDLNADPSSGVDNSRYGGTYAAPEARLATDKVTRTSDVWSLGCVLALVLTFMDGGSKAIRAFGEVRLKDRDNDRFFEATSPENIEATDYVLHSSVSTWLDTLTENAYKRNDREGDVVEKATKLLQSHMLLVDPGSRYSAKDVETQFRSIHATFSDSTQSLPVREQSEDPGPQAQPPPPLHIQNQESEPETSPEQEDSEPVEVTPTESEISRSPDLQSIWHFELPDAPRECKFSHNGKYLGVLSSSALITNLVTEIQAGKSGENHRPPMEGRWVDFSLGTKYLCAALESNYFECCYVPLSSTDFSFQHHVQMKIEAPIRKVVMSPNDEITVFLIEEEKHQGGTIMRLALFRTDDILGGSSQNGDTTSSSRATSRISRSSDCEGEELPWPSMVREYKDFELPTTAGLVDLKFSHDSKVLMAITQPYKPEHNHIPEYSIITWDVVNGRRLSMLTTKNEASENIEQAWRISKFALFSLQPSSSFAAISKTKIRLGSYDHSLRYQAHSHTMADQVLDILVDEAEREFIIIGRHRFGGKIKAFRVATGEIYGVESLERSVETGLDEYEVGRDCSCVFEEEGSEGRGVVVANIGFGDEKGKLAVSFLD